MKKLAIILIFSLLLTGCGKGESPTLSVSDEVLMEQLGVDMEDFNAMRPQEQEQLLEELGIGAQECQYTLEDAEGQGRYMVVLSDTPGYNTFTLYYEDGELVQVVTSFRKSAQDTPTVSRCQGYQLEDYHYKGIAFAGVPAAELAQHLSEEGFAQVSIAPVE